MSGIAKNNVNGSVIFLVGLIVYILGQIIGGMGGAVILLSGFILALYGLMRGVHDWVQQRKRGHIRNKKVWVLLAAGVAVIAVTIYPLYARDSCSRSASRHFIYTRYGEAYSSVTDNEGNSLVLSRDNYIDMCMQELYKI